jgi:hypothetical protein
MTIGSFKSCCCCCVYVCVCEFPHLWYADDRSSSSPNLSNLSQLNFFSLFTMTVWLTKKYFSLSCSRKKKTEKQKRNGNLFSYTYRIPIYVYNKTYIFFKLSSIHLFSRWRGEIDSNTILREIHWMNAVTASRRRRRERPCLSSTHSTTINTLRIDFAPRPFK